MNSAPEFFSRRLKVFQFFSLRLSIAKPAMKAMPQAMDVEIGDSFRRRFLSGRL